MIDEKTERILAELFGRHTGWEYEDKLDILSSPGFKDIAAFASLLGSKPSEEVLQQFLSERPQFIFGVSGGYDECDLAFLTKPPIGTQYFADFAILSTSQGGASISLFEIEPSSAPLFTKAGTPAKRLQGALGQIRDWHQWIEPNKTAFAGDLLRLAVKAPRYPKRSENRSFRLRKSQDVMDAWNAFDGMNCPGIGYYILIGRWSDLSQTHRSRLVFLNREDGFFQRVYTYDQLARRAFVRHDITW